MGTIYLGLGSNLGDREATLMKALELLTQHVALNQVSSIYETEPVGYSNQPWFLNLVCRGETDLDPDELLAFVKGIEAQMGRVPSFPNAPRQIDIDLLFYDDQKIESENLIIPHPRIGERGFVLVALAEIAPWLAPPLNAKTIKELLSELTDSEQVRKWGNVSSIGSKTF
ncbi:MAG: 2-amino-4-hydroxy-6-hydroxymethyldihydropteridine diphosphokinase [Chloroflexi bacterium]|nr:2-amino-4-hydroxy-6-hydroxymethyldihydropteridine diphosphokinase [Chloroflexota bacterium]